MALTRIILWLGNTLIFCALIASLTAVIAFLLVEISDAVRFGALGLSVGSVGLVFVFLAYNMPSQETNSDAMLFLVLFWILVPLILAVPYMFTGATQTLGTAYFEAVSALTTTGASTLDADSLSRSLLFWRSLLQFVGGIIAATFAVVILAALNLTGTGVHRSMLFTLKRGELFSRLTGIGRIIAGIYFAISGFCFAGLVLSGTPVFESVCLSLTAVSTGGLTPKSGILADYVNTFGVAVLAISCLAGAMSIAILWDSIRLRTWDSIRKIFNDVETRGLLILIVIVIIFGIFFSGYQHIGTLFFEAIFFVSSTGYDYHVIGIEMLPPAILITIALIGGSALSTASGVKIIRLLLLLRHVATDLNRLTYPSRVLPVKFKGQTIPDRAFLSIWMYFFGYTLVFAFATLALSATGMTYELAVASGAAALSNMGPLLDATLPSLSYPDFTAHQLGLLSAIMLLGRIEILAAFAVLSPNVWRR